MTLRESARSVVKCLLAWTACVVAVTAFAQAPAKPVPDEPRFEIRQFVFEGAKLVPPEQLQADTSAFTGKEKTFADVQRALEAVERAYSRAGYSAVQVVLPEQELDKGVVRFQIIEAKLGRVIVEGNKFFDEQNIRRSLPSLQPGVAPNIDSIARDLRVANESPSKQATVLLRSGQEEATVDAVARVVDEDPFKGSITVDSSGGQKTGRLRVGFGFQHANVADLDHVFSFQYVTAPYRDEDPAKDKNTFQLLPSKDVMIIGMSYKVPLYKSGNSVDFTWAHSNVGTGNVQGFNITGRGSIASLRYTQNLKRIGDYDHRVTYSLDYRAYENKGIRAAGGTNQLVPDVTVTPIGIQYSGAWRRADSESSVLFSLIKNMSSPGDGGNIAFCSTRSVTIIGSGHSECAKPRFTIWRWAVSHTHAFGDDWQVRFGMNGQHTRDMLIPGEQFGVGGVDSVRGFLDREVVNDHGYRGTLELYTPDWGSLTGLAGARARAVVFVDWGRVGRNRPAAGELHGQGIASKGIGLRFSRGNNLIFRTDYGIVTDIGGGGVGTPMQGKGDSRLTFSLSYIY
ncbi:MAG: ShlB/FhaC/HecB family hemolysin secretion/activation protein [Burkholderiales bacterium]